MNDQAVVALVEMLKSHMDDDRETFKEVSGKLGRIEEKVTSLLETRSFGRGVSKVALWAVGIMGTLAATFLSSLITWAFRSH